MSNPTSYFVFAALLVTILQLPVSSQPEPEVDTALGFHPSQPRVGEKIDFTILVTYRDGNRPVERADILIAIHREVIPMTGMMLGMITPSEKEPGVYGFEIAFKEPGPYVIHVHVIPEGRTYGMMVNHFDYGPLYVVAAEKELSLIPITIPALLFISSGILYIGYRRRRSLTWLKIVSLILLAGGGASIAATALRFMDSEQSTDLDARFSGTVRTIKSVAEADVIISGGSYKTNNENSFVPAVVTVLLGLNETVTWYNADGSAHSIVHMDRNPRFASPLLNPGQAWTYTFTEPGIFYYYCAPHPWMQGAIVISSRK